MPEFADWTRAYVMVGDSPVGLREVLLAADGSMYALLQGETALGALQTVRLDSEGRMSAFVIDSTDAWGKMLSIGNAELAARLGSPVIYEQLGRVQFIETFEQGLGLWTQASDGAGKAIAIDPVYKRSGGYSAKLTAGNTLQKYAQLTYCQGMSTVSPIGIAFAYSTPTDFDNITMMVDLWDATKHYMVGVQLDGVNDKVNVWVSGDDWEEVYSVNPSGALGRIFFYVKLTFDPVEGVYKDLKFNQYTENIGTLTFPTEEIVALPIVQLVLRLTGRDAPEQDIAYFDDIILTVAEPE